MKTITINSNEVLTEIEQRKLQTEIIETLKSTGRPGIGKLISYMEESGYFEAPASSNYHSNFKGGLAYHSNLVKENLMSAKSKYDLDITYDEIIIASYCHDLCKMNFYEDGYTLDKNAEGKWVARRKYVINEEHVFGHGEKSALLASRFIELTTAETYMILYHMGRAACVDGRQFDKAVAKCPSIIAMCHADEAAAMLQEATYVNEKEYPTKLYNDYMLSKKKGVEVK